MIGAIFISTLAAETLPRPQNPPANQAERLAALIQPVVAFIVLCSILIHGLSIPFFSLGRRVTTVTRTWSRQPSLPDWALHTRRVERAEDVVVNRDPVDIIERGQAAERAKDGLTSKPPETMGFDEDEKRGRAIPRVNSADTDALTVAVTEPEEAKADNVPDGTGVLAEWKEGPHRIIERRAGPGEEVRLFLHADLTCYQRMVRPRLRWKSNVTHMARAKLSASLVHFAAAMLQCTVLQTHSSAR